MNFRNTYLALATAIAFLCALGIQVLGVNPYVTIAAWGITTLFLSGWLFLNQAAVFHFLGRKSTRYGANVTLILFLVMGILVFVNVLAKQHPWRHDFTRSGTNTLSEQSKKILDGLSVDVNATFFASQNEKDKGEDLLKRYAYDAKRFHYEFVDVDRNPTRAAALGVKRKSTVVLSLGDTNKRVTVTEPTEELVTNALIKLLRTKEVAVYFTVGHDEHALTNDSDPVGYSQLKAELDKQGYTVKEFNLFTEGKVPADAAVLIVGAPHKAFFPKELEVLAAWMKDGGHALVAVDLDVAESGLAPGSRQVAELLKPFGVTAVGLMLVDPLSQKANMDPSVILGFVSGAEHPITKDFPHSSIGANFLFPISTYLTSAPNANFEITQLSHTSARAWAESDWSSLRAGHASFDQGKDHMGEMDLAYAVESKKAPGQSQPSAHAVKLVVFADGYFATNNLLDKVGNRDLILNSVNWLADEDKFISIRPKEDLDALKQFNNNIVSFILLIVIFVVPLLLVGIGTYAWWRRSKL